MSTRNPWTSRNVKIKAGMPGEHWCPRKFRGIQCMQNFGEREKIPGQAVGNHEVSTPRKSKFGRVKYSDDLLG